MKLPLLKLLFTLLFLSKSLITFSQKDIKGTYYLVNNPSDAPRSPSDEFPIYGYKAVLKLKGRNKFEYITTDLVGANKQVNSGKWSLAGKILKLEIATSIPPETRDFEMVKLKSGEYIKPVNDYFQYFKKE